MKFKKIRYDSGENIVKIKIEDETRRMVDKWILMMSDLPNWFNIIKRKYGVAESKMPRDLEWIK